MKKRIYRTERGRKRHRQRRNRQIILMAITCLSIIAVVYMCKKIFFSAPKSEQEVVQSTTQSVDLDGAPPLDVQLLTVNPYSRPQLPLDEIKGVVIHYTANPGSSAQENRNYFENLKDEQTTKVSSHFIVGLEGEIIQCIPSSEISYASNERNSDTLAIECCHPDESGQFNAATYQSLVELTGYLCNRFGLTSSDVIRHYDITEKPCPKYFVEHEDAWEQFKKDVESDIEAIKK